MQKGKVVLVFDAATKEITVAVVGTQPYVGFVKTRGGKVQK